MASLVPLSAQWASRQRKRERELLQQTSSPVTSQTRSLYAVWSPEEIL